MEGRHGLVEGDDEIEGGGAQEGHEGARGDDKDEYGVEVENGTSTACEGGTEAHCEKIVGQQGPGRVGADEEDYDVEEGETENECVFKALVLKNRLDVVEHTLDDRLAYGGGCGAFPVGFLRPGRDG